MSKNKFEQTPICRQPRIGITMRFDEKGDFYLRRDYSEALAAQGAIGLHLPLIAQPEFLEEALSGLDGLLLPGSDSDVDPLLYGAESHQRLGKVQALRDKTDLLLLTAAERLELPILGICYGMQVLNVSRGGSLVQDLESQIPLSLTHQQKGAREERTHAVFFESNSRLSGLAQNRELMVNSHHHQSIDVLGRNLKIAARAADNVIEAVEDPRQNRFVVGVQWHPELDWRRDEFSQHLFADFIKAAKDFAQSVNI